jgi:peptidoglycan/LPS O-acetylase OafA/YrhL
MQRGSFDLVRYLIARFVRIYIVYIPALVITEAVFLFHSILFSDPGAGHIRPLFSEQPMDIGGVSGAICHLAGLQGFSCHAWDHNRALWSLGYEWALYLFAPAIIGLIVWEASPGLRLKLLRWSARSRRRSAAIPMKGCFGSLLGTSAPVRTAFCAPGSFHSQWDFWVLA